MKTTLRPLRFQKSYLPHAEGSCLVTMGKTQVLCVATVEEGVPPHAEEKGTGWITAEYAMLPRAGEKRSHRVKSATGGRAQEISRLVGRSLRAAVDMSKLGPRTITIDCDVIRADGGTRTASINGGFVALVQALAGLKKKNLIEGWPLADFVAAVSIGFLKKGLHVDMDYAADKDALADMNFVMTGRGQIIELQASAEGGPIPTKDVSKFIRVANGSIQKIIRGQKKALGKLP